MNRILVAEDNANLRQDLASLLESDGHSVSQAEDGAKALHLLGQNLFQLIITDFSMPGASGLQILDYVKEQAAHIPVIVITDHNSVSDSEEAMRLGAYDFQVKPLNLGHLRLTVKRALEEAHLRHAYDYLRAEQPYIYRLDKVLAESAAMKKVIDQVIRVAPSDATVMLTGESGTGKSLIAGAIHANSLRRDHTIVTVNCAALPEGLLESELFGHEKGSFTGAHKTRTGRIQQAHGGTLFLDEVGDMAPATQAKTLRAIEDRMIRRVGGSREIHVDVRIIAATNKDLIQAVEEGTFREDLYYRLNVAPIHLPPLRERREDVIPLAEKFLQRLRKELKRAPLSFVDEARQALRDHNWPGNIRELRNVVERALLFTGGTEITMADLGLARAARAESAGLEGVDQEDLNLESLEKRAILTALERSDWVQSRAAKMLGVSPRALVYKINKHAITHARLEARRRKR